MIKYKSRKFTNYFNIIVYYNYCKKKWHHFTFVCYYILNTSPMPDVLNFDKPLLICHIFNLFLWQYGKCPQFDFSDRLIFSIILVKQYPYYSSISIHFTVEALLCHTFLSCLKLSSSVSIYNFLLLKFM